MKQHKTQEAELYRTIVELRRLFHQLANTADELHEDLGITASQRAVLETLATEGPASVSTIARRKQVSRQHIQALVNRLFESGLVESVDNPAHQRSPLIQLTHRGARSFESVQAREAELLRAMAKKLRRRDFGATADTLHSMGEYLEEGMNS